MNVYKVRNAEGLWSRGGVIPEWSKTGKTWSDRAAMLRHVVQVAQYRGSKDQHRATGGSRDIDKLVAAYWPQDWEIVPFELHELPAVTGASIRKA